MWEDFMLYVILDKALAGGRDLIEVAGDAISGGADAIQLRDKRATAAELIRIGRGLRKLTQRKKALFIVNDRVDIALALNADGVHLGQDDLPIDAARGLMGENKIIGISTHSLEQALKAEREGADYIGVGPIFPTPTKPDYPAIGIEIIPEIKKNIHIPFVAIGGINSSNVSKVVDEGAESIAVARAVVQAKDISGAARELKEKLKSDPIRIRAQR